MAVAQKQVRIGKPAVQPKPQGLTSELLERFEEGDEIVFISLRQVQREPRVVAFIASSSVAAEPLWKIPSGSWRQNPEALLAIAYREWAATCSSTTRWRIGKNRQHWLAVSNSFQASQAPEQVLSSPRIPQRCLGTLTIFLLLLRLS
jgi:hypothetical protein